MHGDLLTWFDRVATSVSNYLSTIELPDAVYGPDVSKHQGKVDWKLFEDSGDQFAFCKATEGQNYVDPCFQDNIEAIFDKTQMIAGAYHFARVSRKGLSVNADLDLRLKHIRKDARGEAGDFLHQVMPWVERFGARGFMRPVLDIEWDKRATKAKISAQEILTFCLEFASVVRETTGKLPIIYTGPSFWKYKLSESLELAGCPLWLVDGYRPRSATKPRRPIEGWTAAVYQYTNARQRPDRPDVRDPKKKRTDHNSILTTNLATLFL